jgi:hypothetical protein
MGWLFGGLADSGGAAGPEYMADLWTREGASWRQMHGGSGRKGGPGGREGATLWVEPESGVGAAVGRAFLFGGFGHPSPATVGTPPALLGDLYRFSLSGWESVSPSGHGVGPGPRRDAAGWVGLAGTLWLYGGFGQARVAGGGQGGGRRFPGGDFLSGEGAKKPEVLGDLFAFDVGDRGGWREVRGPGAPADRDPLGRAGASPRFDRRRGASPAAPPWAHHRQGAYYLQPTLSESHARKRSGVGAQGRRCYSVGSALTPSRAGTATRSSRSSRTARVALFPAGAAARATRRRR